MPEPRPVWLDLLAIRLPLPGWLSLIQRGSGVALALAFPLLVGLLAGSLSPEAPQLLRWGRSLPGRVLLAALVWLAVQHALGGLRYLLLDVGLAGSLVTARRLSVLILLFSAFAALRVLLAGD